MALDIRAERQRAHVLLDRLAPAKLGAVCSMHEVIVDDDELTEDDRTAIQAGLDSLKTNGGVPMEDVLADFGLTLADFEQMADSTRHHGKAGHLVHRSPRGSSRH